MSRIKLEIIQADYTPQTAISQNPFLGSDEFNLYVKNIILVIVMKSVGLDDLSYWLNSY